ncbi:MAG: OsmC family protein [Deltaproteobacteria bacterium]|nr:OsmC family protein [Deltaproteobacteria bacterium]
MVQINLIYEGELRVRAIHGPSGKELVTDAPLDNQGRGESFSPTDLVCTALGSCMVTIMGIVAARHQIDLKGTTISVKKHMIQEPVRRIGKIEVHLKMPAGIDEKERKILERAARTCPVHESLHPDVIQEIQFDWA